MRSDSSQSLYVVPRGLGEGFRASIRSHILELADPYSGDALAPTPDDLFVTSLASQLAWSTRALLRARGLPDDVSVVATWRTRSELSGPDEIDLTVTLSNISDSARDELASTPLFEEGPAVWPRSRAHVHISVVTGRPSAVSR